MVQEELILDRYEPVGTAGKGGFGTVQIAWDPRIQRRVAIKTIQLTELDAYRAGLPGAQAVSGSPTADRWHGAQPWNEFLAQERDQITSMSHVPGLDEARTAALLSDPRIVTVYDFEVRDRTAYLIMEYVEGITLTQLMVDYPDLLTLDMVAAVFDSVAGALEVAHGSNVLHLDIKPDNILINPQGQVKVTDFGLATLADASGAGTTGGGTIGYMPLEQMRREHLDARTDEWSLAAVCYEMLTGDNPFRVRGLDKAEAAIEEAELILPSLCWEHLDEQADDVVFYALDPDREERYASVSDFAEEMDKFLGDADKGREQLALIVCDALGLDDDEDWDDEEGGWGEDGEWAEGASRAPSSFGGMMSLLAERLGIPSRGGAAAGSPGRAEGYPDYDYGDGDALGEYGAAPDGFSGEQPVAPVRMRRGPTLTDRVLAKLSTPEDEEGLAEEDGYEDDAAPEPAARAGRGAPRPSLRERASGFPLEMAARVFPAAACGAIACFALSNIRLVYTAFGPGAQFVVGVIAIAVAVLGALVGHAGALVAFCLLGIAVMLAGHPIVGAVVLVLTLAWWYISGHVSKASVNAALLMPVAGSVGGASLFPFFAGAFCKPLDALVTTVFGVAMAFVLASFGSQTLLGWGVMSHWHFAGADVVGNLLDMFTRIGTWSCVAGWFAGALALSLLYRRGGRVLSIVAVAVALVCVVGGTLAFAAPTPQLLVSCILGAVALIVIAE